MKAGDYVRTKYGKIGKIIDISKNRVGATTYLVEWGSCKAYYVSQVKDYKSSPNIIDLIEVGDYVNGLLIKSIGDRFYNCGHTLVYFKDIKKILTKEQFESMEYKIGE